MLSFYEDDEHDKKNKVGERFAFLHENQRKPNVGRKDRHENGISVRRTNMHHYITKYEENGVRYAESWLQINVFGKCYCFAKRKINI